MVFALETYVLGKNLKGPENLKVIFNVCKILTLPGRRKANQSHIQLVTRSIRVNIWSPLVPSKVL